MFKFVGISSEQKPLPIELVHISERPKRYDDRTEHQYCTYAWIETDEVETNKDNKIPIAVKDSKYMYSKRTQFVFEEPIWDWIEEERTEEQQKWIEQNINKLNDMFIIFAHID